MDRKEGWIKHFPRKDSPSYIIATPRAAEHEPWWKSFRYGFYHCKNEETNQQGEYAVEWSILRRNLNGKLRGGFGFGFWFTRNGEDDAELSLYLGPLLSFWIHANNKFLRKHLSISKEKDPKHYYEGRVYGLVFGYASSLFTFKWGACEMGSGQGYPGIDYSSSNLARKLLGFHHYDTEFVEEGTISIPLPEGSYPATWKRERSRRSYTKPLGKWIDRIHPQQWHHISTISIEGGIPIEGKGENSYDCGMDGLFSQSGGGNTSEAMVGAVVEHVLKYRKAYGGPHNLPRPMSVREAEEWQKEKNDG